MNRPLSASVVLPTPPEFPETLPASPLLRSWLGDLTRFSRELVRAVQRDLGDIHGQINGSVQGVGADLPSKDDDGNVLPLTPTHPIHRVTGDGAIQEIKAPQGFSGPIFLIVAEAWTLAIGGNIAIDLSPTVGQVVGVVYNSVTELWHPMHA